MIVAAYSIIATGTILPLALSELPVVYVNICFFIFYAIIKKRQIAKVARAWVLLIVFMVFYIPAALQAVDLPFLVKKFEGAVLCSLLASMYLYEACRRVGVYGLMRGWLTVCCGILLITLVYKLQYGVWDRSVRFFINGPIVFGWLMGSAALFSLYFAANDRRSLPWFLLFGLFAAAVVWTASKGPLVALTAIGPVALLSGGLRRVFVSFAAVMILVSVGVAYAPERSIGRYESAITSLRQGDAAADGSVGPRKLAWQEARQMFYRSPLLGGGLGNFQFNTSMPLTYPHNLLFEAAAEAGLLGLTGLGFLLILLFKKTLPVGRIWLLFVAIGMQFSGDVSYLRILIAFPMALFAYRRLYADHRIMK